MKSSSSHKRSMWYNLDLFGVEEYAAAAKSLQSCPTLCDPIDGSPPGSPIPGILQARTLEWSAISFSNTWKRKVKVKSLSCIRLLATLWTVAYQAPLSMGFARQEYWSRVPLLSFMINHVLENNLLWIVLNYYRGLQSVLLCLMFSTNALAI